VKKPLHRWWLFWVGPALFAFLGLLMADSCFRETYMAIPRGAKVPLYLYVNRGVLHVDFEESPDPYVPKDFDFGRSSSHEGAKPLWTVPFHRKLEARKYQRPEPDKGEPQPLLVEKFAVPIWMIMTVVAGLWGIAVLRRSKRMARESMKRAGSPGPEEVPSSLS
jgi:hypothetical protein